MQTKQRNFENKKVNFQKDIYQEEEEEEEDYDYLNQQDEHDHDNEYNQLESNNFTTTTFEYKHDRLKKICSMALDLQTKLQQTKLKLFGANRNNNNNNNNDDDDDYAMTSELIS